MMRLNQVNARGVYNKPDKGKSPLMAVADMYGTWKGIDAADRDAITNWFGGDSDEAELGTAYEPSIGVGLPETRATASINNDIDNALTDKDVKDAASEYMLTSGALPVGGMPDDEELAMEDPLYYDESLMSLPVEEFKLGDDMSWLLTGE